VALEARLFSRCLRLLAMARLRRACRAQRRRHPCNLRNLRIPSGTRSPIGRSEAVAFDAWPRARYSESLFVTPSCASIGRLVAVTVATLVAIGAAAPDAAPPPDDVRALWVTRATLVSPEAVSRMVRAARAGGFNTLLVQVRGRGDAYYESAIEPRASELAARPGFDPLAATLTKARAAGLNVHAWVGVNLVSSAVTMPAARTHVVYRHPDWLMVPRQLAADLRRVDVRSPEYLGRLARWSRSRAGEVEGLYTSPIHPASAAYVATVVRELVTRYDVDGIHLDYVRFPGDDFDYSRGALAEFRQSVQRELSAAERRTAAAREAVDPLAYPNLFPDRWNAFRRSRLTALVMRVRTTAKAARPDLVISAAVVPDVEEAYSTRLQDWRTWLDQSLLDVLCPMAYSPDARVFERQVAAATQYAGFRPVWAGIGAYRLTSADTLQYISAARRLGSAGVILFSYDALTAPPNTASTLTELGRAAFGDASQP
jgi:uncharacterized lipoprotein YddW (UPF0748 family)